MAEAIVHFAANETPFFRSYAVLLQLLQSPFQLRCANGPFNNLTHSGAGVTELSADLDVL